MKKKLRALMTAFIMSFAMADYAMSAPIEIVVPTPPGGAIDITARGLSKAMSERGYDNIVTYHPGANGDIALNLVNEKKNNTILVASSANFVFSNIVLNRDNVYARDTVLLGPVATNPLAFIVATNSQYKNVSELIQDARRRPVSCAASNSHGEIELRLINQTYGTQFEPILYKGTGQLIPDVVGGHVPCAYDQVAPFSALEGKIRFLATSQPYRKDIPTVGSVLSKYSFVTWYGAAIPKGSNLLQDGKLVEIVSSWTQNTEAAKPLVDKSFGIPKPDTNLNARALKETVAYRNLKKN